MSKTMKGYMMRDYRERVGEVPNVLVLDLTGLNAIKTNLLRAELRKDKIRLTRIRNKLFVKTYEGRGGKGLMPLLTGPSVVAYGGESVVDVARKFVELVKKDEAIALRGAMLDGDVFEGKDGVERLSKFPTRDEAIAKAVGAVQGPGRKLVGAILGPGRTIGGLIKAIETKLEKGEAIAKVG